MVWKQNDSNSTFTLFHGHQEQHATYRCFKVNAEHGVIATVITNSACNRQSGHG